MNLYVYNKICASNLLMKNPNENLYCATRPTLILVADRLRISIH